MAGFIKLHRKILNWEWYSDINTTRLFLHLLLTATHKSVKYKGRAIERGELITTLPRLSEATNLTIKELRTACEHLMNSGEISKKTAGRETVINVINYAIYQGEDNDNGRIGADKGQDNGRIRAGVQNKNEQEYNKNVKEKELIVRFFDCIWSKYPEKKGKGQVSATKKKELYAIGFDELSRCIERYVSTKEDWKKWQNGSTFFNSGYVDYLDANWVANEMSTDSQPTQQTETDTGWRVIQE